MSLAAPDRRLDQALDDVTRLLEKHRVLTTFTAARRRGRGSGAGLRALLERAGRDPAQGASVLLTFATDSCGFFFFLGLARLFLV